MENGLPSSKPVLPPITSSPEASSTDVPLDKDEQTNVQHEKNPITGFMEASDFVTNPFEYSSTTLELLEELKNEKQRSRRVELCRAHVQAGLCELTRTTWDTLGFRNAKQWVKLESKQDAALGNWKNLVQIVVAGTDDGDDVTTKQIVDRGMVTFALEILRTNILHPSSYSKFQPQISWLLLKIVYNVIRKWRGGLEMVRAITESQKTVSKYTSSGDPAVKTLAIILLAYVLREAEQKQMPESSDVNIKFIVQVFGDCLKSKPSEHFSEEYGCTALEIMTGIRRIAAAEASKDKLVAYGALPLYAKVLKGTASPVDEQKEACEGLWTLAFSASNRARIAVHTDCMAGLRRLAAAADESLKFAANGALWVIEREAKHTPAPATSISATDSSENSDSRKSGGRLMISYHRAIRQQVVRVKDKLVASGYAPWMDIEQIRDYTPEAISKALDDASTVLIFYTERYKLSSSCRLEAQYANKREKKLIPIKMDSDYRPDGWLAVLLGNRLNFDFTQEDQIDAVFQDLCSEIQRMQPSSSKRRAAVQDKADSKPASFDVASAAKTINLEAAHQQSRVTLDYSTYKANEWKEDEVKGWLVSNRLEKYLDRFYRYPGGHIIALRRLMDTAPEFFYNSMKTDYGFDRFDMLTFTNMLQSLD